MPAKVPSSYCGDCHAISCPLSPLLSAARLPGWIMSATIFPWRCGNALALHVDGERFMPAMLAAIDAASWQLDLEFYLLEEGACAAALVTALEAACRRGVRVRCLFDALGGRRLGQSVQRLQAAGVILRWYNPLGWRHGLRNLHRDHRKLLLVDARQAWVGGAGITDDFWHPQQGSRWHELMVAVAGPVVEDLQQLFEQQWLRCAGDCGAQPAAAPSAFLPPAAPLPGAGLARVAYADAGEHRDILQALLRQISEARQRVWLVTPYFLPGWKVRRALRHAARRGVEVRLLLAGAHSDHPPVHHAAQRYYLRLLKNGVRIFEYQPRFLHCKVVLVDDWVTLGSCNFDRWTLRYNLEANLEVLDPAFARTLQHSLAAGFARACEVTLPQWQDQSWWQRLLRRLWGWVDQVVINGLDRWR